MSFPWIESGEKVLGLHEIRDIESLSRWLKSDGRTLGNPAKMPWCGDFVDTALSRGLRDEPRPGALGVNPYWALNWGLLGVPCAPVYACIATFVRPGGGHVGFLVGEAATHFLVLGGNQGNKVSRTWIDKKRLKATRWPLTFPNPQRSLPQIRRVGAVSKNEA